MSDDNLGDLLTEKRKLKGYTQKELSNLLCISDKTLSRWETGKGLPDADMMYDISKILDIPLKDLLKYSFSDSDNSYIKLKEEFDNKKHIIKSKYKRVILFLNIIVVILIILFFISTFNRFKIYNIGINSNNINIVNGILIDNNNELILSLPVITINDIPVTNSKVIISYMDNNKKKKIYLVNNLNYSFNIIFDIKYKKYIDNLYIDIYSNGNIYEGKLTLTKRISNISNNNTNKLVNKDIIINNLLKKEFSTNDNNKYYSKNKEILYIKNINNILFKFNKNKEYHEYVYNIDYDNLYVKIYDKNLNIKEEFIYNGISKSIECKKGKCNNYKEIYTKVIGIIDDSNK